MARTDIGFHLTSPAGLINGLIARPDIQSRLSRLPVARWFARRDGADIFEIIQGFVSSQVVMALVQLEIFDRLADGPAAPRQLALALDVDPDRLAVFLQAGAALKLLRRHRDGRFGLSRKGAALRGVPGLTDMILHHTALFRDLEAPVDLVRGKTDTELSGFWPYVLSPEHVGGPAASRYSKLMADSQRLVAEDTLRQVRLRGVTHLMDVGGGSGAFLAAVAQAYPDLTLSLFDLPQTRDAAQSYLSAAGLDSRVTRIDGSFKTDPLPRGADAISLIRVLYDHDDATVAALLAAVFEALPPGGRLIISEPLSGGARPDPITDVYFALYTMAMGTGRTRSAADIRRHLTAAGFDQIAAPRPLRSYVTGTLTAVKPEKS
ncbi:MAG: methyltransferase [Pseudomonadota bacterium]